MKYGSIEGMISFDAMIRKEFHSEYDAQLAGRAYAEVWKIYQNLEKYGYKLNKIDSGEKKYSVTKEEGKEFKIIGTYNTLEEAKNACMTGDEEIDEFDPNERYALLTLDGKNATGKIYDNEGEPVAYVLDQIREETPEWRKWIATESSPDVIRVKRRMRKVFDKIFAEEKEV